MIHEHGAIFTNMSQSIPKYVRNADMEYVCPHCGIVEAKQNTMLYHIQSKHEHKFRFECTRCETNPKFLQRCTYLHHLATIHPENPHVSEEDINPYAGVAYNCPCCIHTTHTKANILIHFARSHCKDWIPAFAKATPCTECGKQFASSSAYLYHAIGCFKMHATEEQRKLASGVTEEATVRRCSALSEVPSDAPNAMPSTALRASA